MKLTSITVEGEREFIPGDFPVRPLLVKEGLEGNAPTSLADRVLTGRAQPYLSCLCQCRCGTARGWRTSSTSPFLSSPPLDHLSVRPGLSHRNPAGMERS